MRNNYMPLCAISQEWAFIAYKDLYILWAHRDSSNWLIAQISQAPITALVIREIEPEYTQSVPLSDVNEELIVGTQHGSFLSIRLDKLHMASQKLEHSDLRVLEIVTPKCESVHGDRYLFDSLYTKGHTAAITKIVITGKHTLATSGRDGTLRLWDSRSELTGIAQRLPASITVTVPAASEINFAEDQPPKLSESDINYACNPKDYGFLQNPLSLTPVISQKKEKSETTTKNERKSEENEDSCEVVASKVEDLLHDPRVLYMEPVENIEASEELVTVTRGLIHCLDIVVLRSGIIGLTVTNKICCRNEFSSGPAHFLPITDVAEVGVLGLDLLVLYMNGTIECRSGYQLNSICWRVSQAGIIQVPSDTVTCLAEDSKKIFFDSFDKYRDIPKLKLWTKLKNRKTSNMTLNIKSLTTYCTEKSIVNSFNKITFANGEKSFSTNLSRLASALENTKKLQPKLNIEYESSPENIEEISNSSSHKKIQLIQEDSSRKLVVVSGAVINITEPILSIIYPIQYSRPLSFIKTQWTVPDVALPENRNIASISVLNSGGLITKTGELLLISDTEISNKSFFQFKEIVICHDESNPVQPIKRQSKSLKAWKKFGFYDPNSAPKV